MIPCRLCLRRWKLEAIEKSSSSRGSRSDVFFPQARVSPALRASAHFFIRTGRQAQTDRVLLSLPIKTARYSLLSRLRPRRLRSSSSSPSEFVMRRCWPRSAGSRSAFCYSSVTGLVESPRQKMKSASPTKTSFPPFSISSGSTSALPEREQDLRSVLLVAIAAVAVLLPIIILGIPNGADLANHFRFVQPFYESIQAGHWHPGWLAESNNGFGDPRFRFYPPGLYYLLSGVRMLTGNWYAAGIATFMFLSIAGGLGTYLWARAFSSAKIAMWAGVLYTIAPYHINELFQASLLSEYAACAILPFAFAFAERICRDRRMSDVAGLAAAYALLVVTHLPMAVIGSISLAIYAALRLERKGLAATVTRLVVGIGLGLAASAFFWVTMLAELPWIKGNSSEPNVYYDYRVNFLLSPAALANRNTWYANILALALIGFLLPGVALSYRFLKDQTTSRGLKAALLLSVMTLLMATAISRPVWAMVPRLAEIQFPWRWLAIPSLAGCLLVAASIPKWKEVFHANLRPRDLAVALAFALSLVFVATQIVQDCEYLNRSRFDEMTREIRGAPSFN